jgi:hypothetical protein
LLGAVGEVGAWTSAEGGSWTGDVAVGEGWSAVAVVVVVAGAGYAAGGVTSCGMWTTMVSSLSGGRRAEE